MKYIIAAALVFVAPFAANAAEDTQRVEPAVQALGTMVQACISREAAVTTQVFALQAQVAELQAQIATEKKRADEAEARLPKPIPAK